MANYIFDFDGTLVTCLEINYDRLKKEIQEALHTQEDITPMFDKVVQLSSNSAMLRRCFDLIDAHELAALESANPNAKVLDMYLCSKYKIVLSRNGYKVIDQFFKTSDLPAPDFVSCRDNSDRLKPDVCQIETVLRLCPSLNKDSITIVGDSWHDELLSRNFGCRFLKV